MFQRARLAFLGLVVLCLTVGLQPADRAVSVRNPSRPQSAKANASHLAKMPLRFEANAGQWDPLVRFVAHGNGTTLFLTDDGMTVALQTVTMTPRNAFFESMSAVSMKLVGIRPSAPVGEMKLVTKSNFFLGNDRTKWRTDVANFAEVHAKQWLPGVDVVWHGGANGLEYDLAVAAGTDASTIVFDIEGATELSVSDVGALEVRTPAGTLEQKPPRVIQDGKELRSRYRLEGNRRVGFTIEDYRSSQPVLIDPVLVYSTYVGGTKQDAGADGLAVDASGSAYFAGFTASTDFPTASALQSVYGGGLYDVVVGKLNPSGSSLVYSTYLGGSSPDYASGIAVDATGNAFVVGQTGSGNFPTTVNAFQGSVAGSSDAFVAKLSPTGNSLVYSTYLGGIGQEGGSAIALDGSGNVYITGVTDSGNFPTVNAFQGSRGGFLDGFVTKLNSAGSSLLYSTYLGGSGDDHGHGIAVDANDSAYVVGITLSSNFPTASAAQGSYGGAHDAFVTKLSPTGSSLVYSTFLGGTAAEDGLAVVVDGSGSAYVTGSTSSTNFPTASPMQGSNAGAADAYVTKLSASGSSFVYSTYLGGTSNDYGRAIKLDLAGDAYIAGGTMSTDFPTVNPTQGSNAGSYDAFVAELNPAGSALLFSTYVGGTGSDQAQSIELDSSNNTYVGGFAASTNFPTVNPAQGSNAGAQDIFVAKLSTGGPIPLGISPSSTSVAPRGSKTFTAFGGSGMGYSYSLSTNASGGTINASTGAYVAGTTANVTDVVTVTDSNNDTATANVTVGPGVSISPSSPASPPKGTINLAATGGSGTGFTWSFATNASGGAINASTGVYTAGATGSVTDVVNVVDSLGNTASVNVNVGPGVSISPGSPSSPPKGTVSFSASGGSGIGFTWSISTNNSGGSINAGTGVYTAGMTGSVTDVVRVADSLGNTASVNVNVGPGVSITPGSPSSPPNGTVSFSASGGSGSGFAWAITTNNSGGLINGGTGAYTAGSTGNSLDTVAVTDSLGNTASVVVNVGAGVTVSPPAPTTPPKGSVSFGASGGSGAGYTWSLLVNNSGGTVNANTGAYTAGATGSVTDTVKVVDSLGNLGSATVTVGATVSISPTAPTVPPKAAIGFSASGGSGSGYTWSLSTNGSGGGINATTGAYVAGAIANVSDVVAVTDSLGNTTNTTINVGPGISISPSLPTAPPKGAIAFSAVGGSGAGFAWSISKNLSGGSIDGSTGAYTAGSTANSVDTVTVADSLGNTASVNVSVGGGLAINPAAPSTPPRGSIAFALTGGSGSGFTWSLKTNESGGTIDPSSGAYTAGSTANVTDVVGVTDSLNNTSSVNVTVTAGVSITPNTTTVAPKASATFSAAGGSGKGYVWSLAADKSGGSITSAGVYTAGATSGVTDTVQLVHSLGNSATATVTIPAPAVNPNTSTGCGCKTTGHSSSGREVPSVLAVLAALLVRRRRRTRQTPR